MKSELSLGIQEADEILKEIRKESSKMPLNISGRPAKKKNEAETSAVMTEKTDTASTEKPTKSKEKVSKSSKSKTNSTAHTEAYTGKCTVNTGIQNPGLSIARYLRDELYVRDSVEVIQNQVLCDIIHEVDRPSKKLAVKSYKLLSEFLVDILVLDKTTDEPVLALLIMKDEHLTPKQSLAAEMLHSAGVKHMVIRVDASGIVNMDYLIAADTFLCEKYAPKCKMCGLPMHVQINGRNRNRFFACADSKNCRYTINIGK